MQSSGPFRGVGSLSRSVSYGPRPVCVGANECPGTPIDGAPVALCARHMRRVYEFAADLITENWDQAVREYVSELHNRFQAPRRLRAPREGFVYFIRLGDRVKVGYTTDPPARLQHLPHEEVIGIVPGTRTDEQAWHKLLADFHVVGEWFRADPALVEQLRTVVSRTA